MQLLLNIIFDISQYLHSSRSDGNGSSLLSSVDLRSYSSEIFQPSFSSKATFCESKFRGRGGQEASAR